MHMLKPFYFGWIQMVTCKLNFSILDMNYSFRLSPRPPLFYNPVSAPVGFWENSESQHTLFSKSYRGGYRIVKKRGAGWESKCICVWLLCTTAVSRLIKPNIRCISKPCSQGGIWFNFNILFPKQNLVYVNGQDFSNKSWDRIESHTQFSLIKN